MVRSSASIRCLKFEEVSTLLHDFTILDVHWLCCVSHCLTNLSLHDDNYQALFPSFQTYSPKLYFYSEELTLTSCELYCPSLLLHFCSVYISIQSDVHLICIITFCHSQAQTNSVMIYEILGKSKRQIFLHLPEY